MDWDTLEHYHGSKDVLVISDIQGSNYGYGLLRALPAISLISQIFSLKPRFTYPKTWRQLNSVKQVGMYPHDWRRLQDIDDPATPYGIITNEYYEQSSPYSIQSLIARCRKAGQPVFLVTNTDNFQYQGQSRPVTDNGYAFDVGDYTMLFDIISDFYLEAGYHLPLQDTKNLFLQDNAILLNAISHSERSITTVEMLFEELPQAPYLPLFSAFTNIFNPGDEFNSSPLEQSKLDGFRKWLQRRIDRTQQECRTLAEQLNRSVIEDPNSFATATQIGHKTEPDVREFLSQHQHSSDPIETKYVDWLAQVISHDF